jgi:hypothetical protein
VKKRYGIDSEAFLFLGNEQKENVYAYWRKIEKQELLKYISRIQNLYMAPQNEKEESKVDDSNGSNDEEFRLRIRMVVLQQVT